MTLAVDRSSSPIGDALRRKVAAYALIDDASLTDGVLPFEISFADAVGNVGAPITSAVNALTGTTMNSPLNDRLSWRRLMYDKSAPRPASADVELRVERGNHRESRIETSYYHGFTAVDAAAKSTVSATPSSSGTWTEHVRVRTGAYFEAAPSSGAHVPQANITVSPVGRALPGKMECFASEFRPRAQESISVAQGFGGSNYVLSRFFRSWKISVHHGGSVRCRRKGRWRGRLARIVRRRRRVETRCGFPRGRRGVDEDGALARSGTRFSAASIREETSPVEFASYESIAE